MKSSFIWFVPLAVLLLIPVPTVHALSVGAPVRTLDTGGFSLAGSIGYLKLDVGDEEVTSKSFFFKGSFAGNDKITPYLKLGFADLEAGPVEGSLDFAYGGGVLIDLLRPEGGSGFRGTLDAQIVWSESSEGGTTLDLQEGQIAFIGSVRTGGTNAYAGIASSFVDLDGGGINESENGQGHIFFGIDYFMDYNFYFNTEAHLFGQDMLSVGVGYQF